MKTINQWLVEYGESHQNPTNKTVHWVCVPLIFFSIIGLLYSIKLPFFSLGNMEGNVALIVLGLTLFTILPCQNLSQLAFYYLLLFVFIYVILLNNQVLLHFGKFRQPFLSWLGLDNSGDIK